MLNISKNRGFSLLEVMVTVSIITALTGISIPAYKKYRHQSVQTEAKQNLAEIYNLQTSHFSIELDYEPDLEKLGFQPSGPLRYNVGAEWIRDNSAVNASNTSLHNVCPPCKNDEAHDKPCCMMTLFSYSKHTATTHDDTENANRRCYGRGGLRKAFADVLHACGGGLANAVSRLKSTSTSHHSRFRYFAIGCISNGKRKLEDLDIWAISHKKRLTSVKDASIGETTCSPF